LVNKAVHSAETNKFKQFYPSDYDDSETVPDFDNAGFVLPEKRCYFFFVNNKRYYISEKMLAAISESYNINPLRIIRNGLVTRYGFELRKLNEQKMSNQKLSQQKKQ
jgi:hypothetical protein